MNRAVPDCLVTGYDHLASAIDLPDADDRHVAAAAIHAHADAIVTSNLKDFPSEELAKHHLEAIHPDEFIKFQFDLNAAEVVIAAQHCRKRLTKPPVPPDCYLDMLKKLSLPKTAEALRAFSQIL